MVTKEQVIAAGYRAEFHAGRCVKIVGSRGGVTMKVETWRANGSVKTWKRQPERFSLPIKFGFRGPYNYLTNENAHLFHLASECTPTVKTPEDHAHDLDLR